MPSKAAKLISEMFGGELKLTFKLSQDGVNSSKSYAALLSQNTRPDELPFRLTIFSRKLVPVGHVDMGRRDAEKLSRGELSPRVKRDLVAKYNCQSPPWRQFNPVRDIIATPARAPVS